MVQYIRIVTRGPSLARAALGWSAFVLALTAAGLASAALEARLGVVPPAVAKAAPAVVTLGVAVPLVLLVHRRHRGPLALAQRRAAVGGMVIMVAAAAFVLGPAIVAGWIDITAVDVAALARFLVVNTVLALALEAVPEELAFRGSVFGSLTEITRPWVAAVLTTGSFVVAPAASIALAGALGPAWGLPTPAPSFAPGGQDPLAYAVLLAAFGTVLVLARRATGSIWTAVGAHLTFLTVNRIVFPGGFDTGLTTTAVAGAELLALLYLLPAGLAFAVYRRRTTSVPSAGEACLSRSR